MRFRDYLQEAAEDYRPELFEFLRTQPDNVLVHFTRADKIGINTNPKHSDPVGIYAFPKSYILSQNFNKNHYFFGMKNIFVIRLKQGAKTLNLSDLGMQDVDKLLDKMGIAELKYEDEYRKINKPGHVLWDTMEKSMGSTHGRKKNILWTKLFKKAGDFDALIDTGDSIIHSNEPNQVVILNPSAYVVIAKMSTTVRGAFKALAERIVRMLADQLLDNYRVYTRTDGYRKYVTAKGTKNNKPLSLSFEYYTEKDDNFGSGLSGQVLISSPLSNDYKTARIRVEPSGGNAKEAVKTALEELLPFVQGSANFPEQDNLVPEVMAAVTRNLGLTKQAQGDNKYVTYKKLYPQGLLTINVSQSRDVIQCNFIIEKKGSSTWGRSHKIYGNGTIPTQEAKADVNAAARKLIQDNLTTWKDAIATHYNPDYDTYSDYDKTYGNTYHRIDSGKELTRLLDFMQSKLQRTIPK